MGVEIDEYKITIQEYVRKIEDLQDNLARAIWEIQVLQETRQQMKSEDCGKHKLLKLYENPRHSQRYVMERQTKEVAQGGGTALRSLEGRDH